MTARYQLWHQSCRDLAHHQQLSQERAARAELLQYQLKELNEFNPQPGEFEQIDEEYKRLANSGQLLTTSQNALALMTDGEDANLQSQLYTAKQLVSELIGMDSKLSGVLDMLEEATIQIAEASDELRHYCDRLDLDPNRLFELEQRISKQISLARKHHVSPEALPQYYQSLLEEQQQLDDQADFTRNACAGGNETSSAGTGNRARITPTTPAICRRTCTADHRQYACALNAAWAVYDRC